MEIANAIGLLAWDAVGLKARLKAPPQSLPTEAGFACGTVLLVWILRSMCVWLGAGQIRTVARYRWARCPAHSHNVASSGAAKEA